MSANPVGRFIGGPMDKVVRALECPYPLYKCAVTRKLVVNGLLMDRPGSEPFTPKVAEYICLEDVNELGQYLYLYAGTK